MRVKSVFNFLKTKSRILYDLGIIMEKFIVLKEYDMACLTAKVMSDTYSKMIAQELVFPVDIVNSDLNLNLEDIKTIHKMVFDKIFEDYEDYDEFLSIYYEFDFSYLNNPKITNEDIYLILKNLKVNSIERDGEMIFLDSLAGDEKSDTYNEIRDNLNEFLKSNVLNLKLYDIEGNPLTRPVNFEAVIKGDYVGVKEIPPVVKLDRYQKDAVEYIGKPLLINAGPGAGKTRVIIERVNYLIEKGADPSSILVITFTNKAADELKERFKKDTNLELSVINQMRISTIHSFCRSLLSDFSPIPYNLLKRDAERNLFFNKHKKELGFDKTSFLQSYQSGYALKKYEEYALFEVDSEGLVDYIEKNFPVSGEFEEYIDDFFAKNPNHYPPKKEIKAAGFSDDLYNARYLQIAKSYPKWIEIMEREHVCDQNYLLLKALEILKDEKNLSSLSYKNILIDEFQDTDAIQMQIFEILKNYSDTFTVVGDADQSIYSFRGANPKFFKDYAESDEFEIKTLVNNYRSSEDIVEFNESYIKPRRHPPKELKAYNSTKMPVFILENRDDSEEYKSIAYLINNLMRDDKISKYSDVCILFRSHKEKKEILEVFESEKIPYYLKGIDDLIYQDEVKAILTLFWYILPFNPSRIAYYGDGGQWVNLSSFTDKYYEASKIFKLSRKTQNILNDIELKYHYNVVNVKNKYESLSNDSNSSSIMDVVRDYSDDALEKIFDDVDKVDVSMLGRDELKDIGITDEHDLDFFCSLNELKASIETKKLTSLQVFYEMLKITGYLDELLSRSDFEAKKASLNIALISEIISDYETIMGKYDLNGLFNYLHRSLKYYSCPINEVEDNSDKVHIMTVHKAKGLEYPVVITASLKEGSFPITYKRQAYKGKYKYGEIPNYPTPNNLLKYKTSEEEEAREFNSEEERIVYVANTRCEELLVLSCINSKTGLVKPKVLNKLKTTSMEPTDVKDIKKVSSHMLADTNLFNKIDFEDILDDYLFCPVRYNLENNLNFQNPLNINKFIDSKLKKILATIHNEKLGRNWTRDEIHNLVGEVIKSYGFASDSMQSKIKELFNNLADYWIEWGKDWEILDYSYTTSVEINGYDINGVVDLIIAEGNHGVSLVHFIRTRDEMRNYHNFYMEMLHFYALALKDEYDIVSLKLHVLDESKQYEVPYDSDKEEFVLDFLSNIVNNVDKDKYPKHEINCNNCEFQGITCSLKRN